MLSLRQTTDRIRVQQPRSLYLLIIIAFLFAVSSFAILFSFEDSVRWFVRSIAGFFYWKILHRKMLMSKGIFLDCKQFLLWTMKCRVFSFFRLTVFCWCRCVGWLVICQCAMHWQRSQYLHCIFLFNQQFINKTLRQHSRKKWTVVNLNTRQKHLNIDMFEVLAIITLLPVI